MSRAPLYPRQYRLSDSCGSVVNFQEVTPAALSNAIVRPPVVGEVEVQSIWDHIPGQSFHDLTVSGPMWHAIQEGATIAELIRASPEDVITALRNHTVRKLGTFEVKDKDVLVAFGAWDEQVTVAAYVVNLKNAAAGREFGLLHPLVQKSLSGATGNEIWEFPAVRAVIEYKWQYWARFYLVVEFVLCLGWMISFAVFLITYIEWDLSVEFSEMSSRGQLLKLEPSIFDVFAFNFMTPFVLLGYNTMKFYKLRSIHFWSILRSISFVLQTMIICGYFFKGLSEKALYSKGYNTVLAVQCVTLFLKMHYFVGVFGVGTSFVELLKRVVQKVSWFFVGILWTIISVALAFAALYCQDIRHIEEEKEKVVEDNASYVPATDDSDLDFSNVAQSLVTTYALILGDFDSDYVFESSNRLTKGFFFLGFQILVVTTVMNLLIAVMTQTYAKVMLEARVIYNMSRAQVMDALEVALPAGFGPNLKPCCHFLVVEKKPNMSLLPSQDLEEQSDHATQIDRLETEIKDLKNSVQVLTDLVKAGQQNLNAHH